MNKKKHLVKNRLIFLLPVLIFFVATGCETPSINLGNPLIDVSNANILITDTISADLSTVFIDSIPTAGTGSILVGRYKDPYFGTIASSSYVQLGVPANVPIISNLAGYDSIALIMRLNKYFYFSGCSHDNYSSDNDGIFITFYGFIISSMGW